MYYSRDRRASGRLIPRNRREDSRHGKARQFLERHQRQVNASWGCGEAARQSVYRCLFRRAIDDRTLGLAADHVASHGGPAPGMNGLHYSDYSRNRHWEMLRAQGQRARSGTFYLGPVKVKSIPKSSGKGTRPLKLINYEDRVVERAIVSILQPVGECFFLPTSFGYRPGRSPMNALLHAENLAATDERYVWITQDLKDAFERVKLDLLMEVVEIYFPNSLLIKLIEQVLQVGRFRTLGKARRGIRQGGSLSPLLLNLYLHHHLDVPWLQKFPETPLLRYADDLLILCRNLEEARERHRDLERMLRLIGMKLKHQAEDAIFPMTVDSQHLPEDRKPKWLGFIISRCDGKLSFEIAESRFNYLAEELRQCHQSPWSAGRARQVISGWLHYLGPAFARQEAIDACINRLQPMLQQAGFEEVLPTQKLNGYCNSAWCSWNRLRLQANNARCRGVAQ